MANGQKPGNQQPQKPIPAGMKNVGPKLGVARRVLVPSKTIGMIVGKDNQNVPIIPRTGESPEDARKRVVTKHPGKVITF